MRKLAAVAAVLIFAAAVAWARGSARPVSSQSVVPGYPHAAAATTYRTAIGQADTVTWGSTSAVSTGAFAVEAIYCSGVQNLGVDLTFSSASATCVVTVQRYGTDGGGVDVARGATDVTFTARGAGSITADGARFQSTSGPVAFDTAGYPKCRVFVAAPSAGTVVVLADPY